VTRAEGARIDAAIAAATADTTGHIAVRVVTEQDVDAFERAKAEFASRNLHRAKDRNAALVLVAPKARSFAVLGDRALHERVGEAFWHELVAEMRPYFARDAIADGIVHAIERVGRELRAHFPAEPRA
jgi:uncharacterized membrane protein